MDKSGYSEIIDKLLPGVVLSTVKKLETTEDGKPPKYRFLTMCKEKYSIDGKWETLLANYSHAKADIVAEDSPLPLKSRPSLQAADGTVPKSGMQKKRIEGRLRELQNLNKLGKISQFKEELMSDPVGCVVGMYENMEYNLLYGLSNGVLLTTEENNVGTATRLDFGYLAENQFSTNWDDAETAKPLDDIEEMITKSNGEISILMMDRATLNKMRNAFQVRADVFADNGGVVVDGKGLKRPSLSALNEYLGKEYGVTIDVVERKIKAERDGKSTDLTPWKAGMIVGIPNLDVADLVYTETAEDEARVEGVSYSKPKNWMLLSVYREKKPVLSETTDVQGIVYPILKNIGSIFTLDTTDVKKKVTLPDSAPESPLNGTVAEVKERLKDVEDKELLQGLLEQEVAGANRKGVTDYINSKLA